MTPFFPTSECFSRFFSFPFYINAAISFLLLFGHLKAISALYQGLPIILPKILHLMYTFIKGRFSDSFLSFLPHNLLNGKI